MHWKDDVWNIKGKKKVISRKRSPTYIWLNGIKYDKLAYGLPLEDAIKKADKWKLESILVKTKDKGEYPAYVSGELQEQKGDYVVYMKSSNQRRKKRKVYSVENPCRKCGAEMDIVQDKALDNGIKRCLLCSKCGYEDTQYKYFKE